MKKTRVKSFKEACQVLGIETTLPDFSFAPEGDRQAMIDHYKLVIISKAVNGEWVPDWGNDDQPKWYPWFDMGGSSGSSFAYNVCAYQCSGSYCGSRLCFETREDAKYVGETFTDLYKSYFVKA